MRNILKKAFILVLVLSLVFSLYGCSEKSDIPKTEDIPTISNNADSLDEKPEEGSFVLDATGRKLYIPEKETVTIASAYAVSVPFIVALDLSDNVLAINYKSKFWADNKEGLAKAGSVGRGIVDLEALASFGPDLLIHRTNDAKVEEAAKNLDIPVMGISAENIDEIYATLDMIAAFCHKEERAEEVKNWMKMKFETISEIVETIPEEEKLTALVLGGELGVIAGGDMLQSLMVEYAGGINVAKDIEGGNMGKEIASAWANIGLEKLFDINPDVMFLTSSTVLDYTVEELLTGPEFSSLEAVKTGRVFLIPAKMDSWDLPGVSCVIGTYFMLHSMYPELVSEEQLQSEIDDYYTFMFGKTFTKESLGY